MAKNNKKNIPIPELPKDETIKLSLRCYDETGEFCLSSWEKEDVSKALKRLKEINRKTYHEMLKDRQVYHFHPVDWNATIKKSGFPDPFLREKAPFQISLLGINSQKARIFGAFDRNIFYIVWFDFNHEISPATLKNT